MADCEETSGTIRPYYAEIVGMTFGKYRIIWTDGVSIENGW